MPYPQIKRHQSGFTLIEIAIVLVIIGLLLGGILKGQELINNARVKNLASDFRNIPVFIYGYQDKFKALPGDDSAASTHLTNADNATTPGVAANRGNGVIEGNWDSSTNTDESFLFWQHVRLAGLAPGSTDKTAPDFLPINAVGTKVGIQSAAPFTGMNSGTYYICSGGISGKFAKQLDTQLDDGVTNKGAMVSGTAPNTSVAGTTPLVDATNYIVCMAI
ncbi:MAG: prepilin-type N-terminal cleavage/methylation domain-containing protein [Thiobacillus sp.]|nr:prepilin-type N-terminal cleavage/methylation domain-containing protein [Thiobacillus sp.]MDP3125771.1 prepilin-type N-terminal cleavage/methylation domain-containing protein [Thiobacillus sp.]